MTKTKIQQIRNKIFSLADLKRIAEVFDEQAKLAKKSSHNFSVEYALLFADDSSIEGDTPDVLEDPYSEIKKPVKIQFRFSNYKLNRTAVFSVTHGNSHFGNKFVISSQEPSWLNDKYTKLLELVNGSKPQSTWISNHSTLVYNLVAIGLGALSVLVIDLFLVTFLPPADTVLSSGARNKITAYFEFFSRFESIFYLLGWFWKWLLGWAWGAGTLARWILESWPNIELDFGADHLKFEKQRRHRIYILLTVVVVPILLSIIQDIVRSKM